MMSFGAAAQKPERGTHTYAVAFDEWQGKPAGATCLVRVIGDSVWIIHNGGNLSGQKGEVIQKGLLLQHRRSGKWFLGHNRRDIHAKMESPCADGPLWIDARRRRVRFC